MSSQVTKFQKFEAVTIHRSELKNAPYNPRIIDASARKKLKDKIKKVGLVETLVWNKRTGNLVSGHQRLSILDDLEGKQDYNITVAVINVDDKTEKELNVSLNNQGMMGNYDLDQLGGLLKECSYEEMGFDKLDIDLMYDGSLDGLFSDKKDKAASDIKDIESMKERRKEYKEKAQKKNDPEYYLMVVFQSSEECSNFLKEMKLPVDERYVDGRKFARLVGVGDRLDKN